VIIWIASFPRSGNNLFRAALYHLFGIKSGSVFPEVPGAADVLDDVSLYLSSHSIERLRAQEAPVFVKTHRLADADDTSPAVYLVRDGRDSLVSYAHFVRAQHERPYRSLSFEEALAALLEREVHPYGSWSANVRTWTRRQAPTAIVHFEELIRDPAEAIRSAVGSLGIPLPERTGELPAFEELHARKPVVARKGVVGSWTSELPLHLEERFWGVHGAEMLVMGYSRDHPLAEARR
jgi:hypothetical protein